MSAAQVGDTVRVTYEGKLTDGTVFDKSDDGQVLEFKIGDQKVITGFEQAVVEMEVGSSKEVTIAPEQAYGDYNDEGVVQVTRSQLPENIEPQVGMRLQAQGANNQPLVVTIKDMDENTVTLDANHPLAGKDLVFNITLQEIL